jgi:hypothetical protein
MNDDKLYELANELRRLNDAIEMLFGLSARDAAEPALVREVQQAIDGDEVLGARGVWAAADRTGQVYLCVRGRFMQPPTCSPVNNLNEANDYLGGMRRAALQDLARSSDRG